MTTATMPGRDLKSRSFSRHACIKFAAPALIPKPRQRMSPQGGKVSPAGKCNGARRAHNPADRFDSGDRNQFRRYSSAVERKESDTWQHADIAMSNLRRAKTRSASIAHFRAVRQAGRVKVSKSGLAGSGPDGPVRPGKSAISSGSTCTASEERHAKSAHGMRATPLTVPFLPRLITLMAMQKIARRRT